MHNETRHKSQQYPNFTLHCQNDMNVHARARCNATACVSQQIKRVTAFCVTNSRPPEGKEGQQLSK